MSNNLNKPSLRQQAKSATSRLHALEQGLARALVGIERRFGEAGAVSNRYGKVLEALVEAVGPEQIQEIVTRRAAEEAVAISAQEVAGLEEGLADGYLSAADEITEQSLIVGHEVDKAGTLVGTGRQQVVFRGIAPQSQAELKGQKVGFKVTTPTGGTFEVKEIYAIDEEKAKAVFTARAEAAAKVAAVEAAANDTEDTTEEAAEAQS